MDLKDKRVVVMGLGRFGGGVGVSRFLVGRGARVLVTDAAPAEQLQTSVAALAGLPIDFRLGEHRADDFTGADLIVVNPAVDRRRNPYLQAAADAGVPTTSEIRLLIERLPNRQRTIGITGSAGKSTVTAMLGHILRETPAPKHSANPANAPRVFIGGNLGGSLLGDLDAIGRDDWVVLELSSFMLEDMAADRWSPHIAIVTNITHNHLDRHGSFEAYARAKQVILDHQTTGDAAILGPIDPRLIRPRTARQIWTENLANYHPRPTLNLITPGEHNRANAMLAIEAAVCAGRDRFAAAESLTTFTGLPHRLQFVLQRAEVRYYNDSKATTPEAAMLAITSFAPGTVHAILGGYDKGSNLSELSRLAASHCRAIYTIGATGDRIAAAARQHTGGAEVVPCGTLDAAVAATATRVREGDVVLLSPGCASWDQFENFEARGRAFAQAVLLYTGEGAPAPGA